MKRVCVGLLAGVILAGCDDVTNPATGATGVGGNVAREYLVLGSTMSFEECRARGGIIIRDNNSPMIACDPRVRREPVPADEFDHPGSPVPQVAEVFDVESDA